MVSAPSPISRNEIQQVLSKIRQLSGHAAIESSAQSAGTVSTSSFKAVVGQVKKGLETVSSIQNQSDSVRASYLKGDPSVSLSQVLVASTHSKIAFEGLLAVRKHFIEAYKEVMNLPI